MIILIGCQKGGTGKSTIATNLSVYFAKEKNLSDFIFVDCDARQSTSYKWVHDREDEQIKPSITAIKADGNITSLIKQLKTKYKHIIIDVAGYDSQECRQAMVVADLITIPTRPSQPDLDTLDFLKSLIETAKDFNEKLIAKVLITQATNNPKIKEIEEAREIIKDIGFDTFNTVIYSRKCYRDAISLGMGVIESNNKDAKTEFESFAKELLDVLKIS